MLTETEQFGIVKLAKLLLFISVILTFNGKYAIILLLLKNKKRMCNFKMKNNKIFGIMMIITVLLATTISGAIAMQTGTITDKDVAQITATEDTQNEENNLNNENKKDENIENQTENTETNNIQELRNSSAENKTVSSRSMQISRLGKVYINTDEESYQDPETYDELKEYIKLEDVKISFDMDVSKTCGLSREDFISLVENMKYDRTGILAKNAGCIWDLCQKYSVNEIFVLGICGIESAWCSAPQHQNTHNYSSLMSGGRLIPYATDEEGFEAMIKLLGERYLTPGASFYHGATITGVGRCYCDPTSWPGKVYTCMQYVFQ